MKINLKESIEDIKNLNKEGKPCLLYIDKNNNIRLKPEIKKRMLAGEYISMKEYYKKRSVEG